MNYNDRERAPHPEKAEQIFMTACVQKAWEAGAIHTDGSPDVTQAAIYGILKAARAAWRQVHTQDRVRSVADTLLAIQATKTLEELKAVGESVKKVPLTASERDSMSKAFVGQRDRIVQQRAAEARSGDDLTNQVSDTFQGQIEQ